MTPVLHALAGTPVFSRISREIYNSGHTLADVENLEYQQDLHGFADASGLIHNVPVAVRYIIHFKDGSVTYYFDNELDRLQVVLAEMDTWSTDQLLKAASAICEMIVNRTIKNPYKSHEDNNDNGNNDRTPAATGKSNAPAAPPISPVNCKTPYDYDGISGKYTLSTDDPEAAPYISPLD